MEWYLKCTLHTSHIRTYFSARTSARDIFILGKNSLACWSEQHKGNGLRFVLHKLVITVRQSNVLLLQCTSNTFWNQYQHGIVTLCFQDTLVWLNLFSCTLLDNCKDVSSHFTSEFLIINEYISFTALQFALTKPENLMGYILFSSLRPSKSKI